MPGKKFKTLVGRTLSAKKAAKPNGSVEKEGHLRTNQPFQNPYPLPQNGRGHMATHLHHPSELNLPDHDKKYNFKAGPGSRQLQEDSIV